MPILQNLGATCYANSFLQVRGGEPFRPFLVATD